MLNPLNLGRCAPSRDEIKPLNFFSLLQQRYRQVMKDDKKNEKK